MYVLPLVIRNRWKYLGIWWQPSGRVWSAWDSKIPPFIKYWLHRTDYFPSGFGEHESSNYQTTLKEKGRFCGLSCLFHSPFESLSPAHSEFYRTTDHAIGKPLGRPSQQVFEATKSSWSWGGLCPSGGQFRQDCGGQAWDEVTVCVQTLCHFLKWHRSSAFPTCLNRNLAFWQGFRVCII